MKGTKNQLKTGVILNYINVFFGTLIPVFYTPVMLELLGQNEYGLYKLSASVTSYLSLISMGLGSAIVRYLIKAREQEGREAEERILGLFHTIFQIISAIVLVAGVSLTFCLDFFYADALTGEELARMKVLVLIMVVNMAVSFSGSAFNSSITSHERFVFLQSMNILLTCIAPVVNLIVLYFGFASIGMAMSTLTITTLVRILYQTYVRRVINIRPRYGKAPKGLLKEIFMFSFWIFVSNVVNLLYQATDNLMIGAVPQLATTGVAIYQVGSVLSGLAGQLTTGITSLLSPRINKMVFTGATNEELSDYAIRIGRVKGLLAFLIISGLIVFGQPFLTFYVGEGYEDAYWVGVLMIVPYSIPLMQTIFMNVLVARNQHKYRSLVYLAMAVFNVFVTWMLLPKWGVIGASFGTGLATLLGHGVVMNIYYWKKQQMEIPRFWKKLAPVFVIPVSMTVTGLLISKWIDFYQLPLFILGVLVFTVIYGTLSWLFVMNEYEKDLVITPIRKLLKRG